MPTSDPTINYLYERRRRLRWTQRYVSERIGTAQSHLCDLESGRVQPNYQTLVKWATALGVSVSWKTEVPLLICLACKERRHSDCPRGTWCDCQHRTATQEELAAAYELLQETREMERTEPLLDDGTPMHEYVDVGWPETKTA